MMSTQQQVFNRTARRQAARRGQSIIIALLVLLLLGIAGGLFITIVARNLINARRSARVGSADAYARAGLNFADSRLTNSPEGADWRPPLQFQIDVAYQPSAGTQEAMRYLAATTPPSGLLTASTDDPDYKYLTAGYTKYTTGAGRFLLRVTYDPVNAINSTGALPPGKYLKIESIGREGIVDSMDPTTYANNRTTDRVQSYQVAYKPIGITDFARFETNPNKRSDIANLGVISRQYTDDPDGGIATAGVYDFKSTQATPPTLQLYPVLTTYGAADAYLKDGTGNLLPNPMAGTGLAAPTGYKLVPGGGSLQANMSTRFFGKNVFYLNNAGTSAPLFQDTIGVAGDILLDSYNRNASLDNKRLDTNGSGQQAAVMLNPSALTDLTGTGFVFPSADVANFSTFGGFVRDGSSGNDSAGLPRSISRLDPPVTDGQDPATQLPRYKALAMNSPARLNLKNTDGTTYTPAANAPNPSQFGYGRDIYVDNVSNFQPESQSVGGGSTLTDEWLTGVNNASNAAPDKGGWNGNLYSPAGVSITLGAVTSRDQQGNPTSYGIALVRAGVSWKNPDGSAGTNNTLLIPYSDLAASNNPDNDIVIYADGNVRVHGVLSPVEGTGNTAVRTPRHITIVSGATAYIEGNLLKGDPSSSISILAHDYVCINTTQFLAGPQSDDSATLLPKADSTTGKFTYNFDGANTLTQEVSFGLTGGTVGTSYASPLALYISGTSSNADVSGDPNPDPAVTPLGDTATAEVSFNLNGANPFLVTFDPNPADNLPNRRTIPLPQAGNDITGLTSGDIARLTIKRHDQSVGDPQIERIAVLPMDIRIEAVLFAQTRSFFVIPGQWFNTNTEDNLARFTVVAPATPSARALLSTGTAYDNEKRFPLYGQPIDLKITVYGSVSEARPADIAAQSEWMRKWGWIPQYHGSLFTGTAGHLALTSGNGANAHVVQAIGLQIIYDPQAGYPYHLAQARVTGDTTHYLRSDKFGRPLPFTPNLPVSTGLLYSGESGEPPLLQ